MGGLVGVASIELCKQLKEAGPDHPLGAVAAYMRENNPPTDATFCQVLDVIDMFAPTLVTGDLPKDLSSDEAYLSLLAWILLGKASSMSNPIEVEQYPSLMAAMRLQNALIEHGAARIKAGEYIEQGEYPELVRDFVMMDVGSANAASEAGAKAGSAKGEANRERVLKLWDEFLGPKNNAGAFAAWAFKKMGGHCNVEGNKSTPEVPSDRTIRKWVNANRIRPRK